MSGWQPGGSPFPKSVIGEISSVVYMNELKFVRHAKVHFDKTPRSLWQLAADFRVDIAVHSEFGAVSLLTITAPRGMYTDLASVPKALWSFAGPIGKHLEISIIHDYLYMAWTDYRETASRQDFAFANDVFHAGLRSSGVGWLQRNLMYAAVDSRIGWNTFNVKSYTLEERMNGWLPHLEQDHGRR